MSRIRVRQSCCVVAVLTAGLAACAAPTTTEGSSASRPTFDSVAAVAKASSVVVQGTLSGLSDRLVDDGGSGTGEGIPMAVYSFEVSRASVGVSVPRRLTVVWVDTEREAVDPDDALPLKAGSDYLLFLEKLTKADRGGLQSLDTIYTPVGSNAGVFPIISGRAVATDRTYDRVSDQGARKATDRPLSLDPATALALPTGKR